MATAEEQFRPTVLIVKQHNVSGKKYLHKTHRLNLIEKYEGSGVEWKQHLNEYGKDWKNISVSKVFEDRDELIEFSVFLSEELNVVESDEWLNKIVENGVGGGGAWTEESKDKIRKPHNEHRKEKRLNGWLESTKDKDWSERNQQTTETLLEFWESVDEEWKEDRNKNVSEGLKKTNQRPLVLKIKNELDVLKMRAIHFNRPRNWRTCDEEFLLDFWNEIQCQKRLKQSLL